MTDHDRTLGQLEGKVDGLQHTVTSLCDKIDKMLDAHAACRQEMMDKLSDQDVRLKTQEQRLDGYVKKAVLICLTLILGGQLGPDVIKKIVEVFTS